MKCDDCIMKHIMLKKPVENNYTEVIYYCKEIREYIKIHVVECSSYYRKE